MTRWVERAALLLILVLAASFCLTRLAEVDFHWHLLAGTRILAEGRPPHVDTFTHTSAGRPWVDLHWLFQVVIALANRTGGWAALDLLKISLIVGAFGTALATALQRAGTGTVAALGLAAVVAAQERFTLRPEATSFLFLALLLFLLSRREGGWRWLWPIPFLMILWANMHALFAVGLGVIVLTLLGEVLERFRAGSDRSSPVVAPLASATGAAIIGTLITPYGWRGWDLPRRLLFERLAGENLYARSIAEFQAPLSGFGSTIAIAAFGLLAVAVLVSAPFAWRRVRAADLLVLAAGLCLALMARRNIPLFALTVLACGAPLIEGAGERFATAVARRSRGHAALRIARRLLLPVAVSLSALLLFDVGSNRFFARDATQRLLGRGEAPGHYPWSASRFVLDHRVPGEVLNDMTSGGFLAWRWVPERRVFIDGRLELHDAGLFEDYLMLQRDPERFEEVARRYGVGTVLWTHHQSPEAAALLRHLAGGRGGWRPVHVDLAASVFVRDEDSALPTVDLFDPRLGERLLDEVQSANLEARERDPLPRWLRGMIPLREVPVAEVSLALFFAVIGNTRSAELLFREALNTSPDDARLHFNLGLVFDRAGRGPDARRGYVKAISLDPDFTPARLALATRLLADGDADGALRQWAQVKRKRPLPIASLVARGALLARRGRLDEAIEDYRRAVTLEPQRIALHTDLALLYHRRGMGRLASAEIGRARAIDPLSCLPGVTEARIRAASGDPGAAERLAREAIGESSRPCPAGRLTLATILASIGRPEEALSEIEKAIRSGLDPSALSDEPALRILFGRPEFRRLLSGGPEAGVEE